MPPAGHRITTRHLISTWNMLLQQGYIPADIWIALLWQLILPPLRQLFSELLRIHAAQLQPFAALRVKL